MFFSCWRRKPEPPKFRRPLCNGQMDIPTVQPAARTLAYYFSEFCSPSIYISDSFYRQYHTDYAPGCVKLAVDSPTGRVHKPWTGDAQRYALHTPCP